MSGLATAAVILARGLGTRMRREDPGTRLEPAQAVAASAGIKGMIPDTRGRPFLDHIVSSLADGGITDVCLVVAPDHHAISAHYVAHPTARVQLSFAIQAEPRGTADALLAAEAWSTGRDLLVLNADNLYSVAAIRALVTLGAPGLVAFSQAALISQGNIDAARIAAFAILELAPDGTLRRIVEKPDADDLAAAGAAPPISMNLWRFDREIFAACRSVPRSPRGEFELPHAVSVAIAGGMRLRAVMLDGGVLDLSHRGDIAAVARRLGEVAICP